MPSLTKKRAYKGTSFWTQEERDIVKQYFLQQDGIKIIQEKLPHKSYNSIKGEGNKQGLIRVPTETKDETFFSIPNEMNAVIAGFFAADGCINDKDNRFAIGLSNKDNEYLHRIKNALKYSGKIYVRQPKESIKIDPYSGKAYVLGKNKICTLLISRAQQWIKDLADIWSITPRKTFTLQPPKITDFRLKLCYISGLIDGDGWITLNNTPASTHGKTLEISVMGTKDLMLWVKEVFDSITPGIAYGDIKLDKSGKVYVFTVRGTRAYLISKVFLSLNILRLDRKWDKAREFIALMDSTPHPEKIVAMIRKSLFNPALLALP